MEIIESWQDDNDNCYAIVKYSGEERREFNNKEYEALWMDEMKEEDPQLNSFAGTVGYRIAEFDTVKEAQDFLLKGTAENATNPDVWWQMLEVK